MELTTEWGKVFAEGRYAIGTVSWKSVSQWYVTSIVDMLRMLTSAGLHHPDYLLVGGLYVISARNILVKQARKLAESTDLAGILWIDDDIQWYLNDLIVLFQMVDSHPEAIIGALYPGREGDMVVGKMAEDWDGKSAVGPAEFLGFGFCYTPMSCFTDALEPWFFNEWVNGSIVGEDVYFCREQKAQGREILGISRNTIRHAHEPGPRVLHTMLRSMSGDTIKFF